MTTNEIKNAIKKGPPFLIKTVDGDQYDVREEVITNKDTVLFTVDDNVHILAPGKIASVSQIKSTKVKMNSSTLKEVAHAKPFAPFVLHLSDGREAPVPAPDFISFPPKGHSLIVWTEEGAPRIISMDMIVELSVEKAQQ